MDSSFFRRELLIYTKPVPDARFRFTSSGHRYTPAKVKEYRRWIATAGQCESRGKLWIGVIRVVMTFGMPIPKSWTKWKKIGAEMGRILPTGVPDLDNLAKSTKDALTGIWWKDDAQVTSSISDKIYTLKPFVRVVATALCEDLEELKRRCKDLAKWRNEVN